MQKDQIYFCHGVPGGPEDARLLGLPDLTVPNLFEAAPLAQFDDLTAGRADRSVHLVGFSIGAMVALRLAAARPDVVGKVTLISPAAPLDLGHFLPDMAGRPVFQMARRAPSALRMLTRLQGLILRISPDFVIDRLFAKADPFERRFIAEPDVRKALRAGLKNAFCDHPTPYVQSVIAYVSTWSGALNAVACPVEIWHGDADRWAPITMSDALVAALPNRAALHRIAGAGHYGALRAAKITPVSR